jgi:hypothetical protein
MPQQFTVEYQKERVNLVLNPSFESGVVQGTTVSTDLTVVNTGAYSGTYALQAVASSTNAGARYSTPAQDCRIESGKTYSASAYVKNTSGVTRSMRLEVVTYTSTGAVSNSYQSSPVSVSAGGAYTRLSFTFNTGSTDYSGQLSVWHQLTNSAIGNAVVIDALLVEESASVGSYFDGNTTDAYWTGTANLSTSALRTTSWVVMENVQQISGSIGRQSLQDTFEPSRMTISARYPTGFSVPNTAFKVDTPMRVKRTGSPYIMWTGLIRNVSVEYEIPYNNPTGVGVADHLDIECEGALAQWGRLQGNNLFVGASDLLTQLSNVLAGTNLNYGTTYTAATAPLLSASDVNDSLANWLNTACATTGSTIKDGSDSNIVGVNGRDFAGNLPVSFSDISNNSANQVYDSIIFDSKSSDYFTEIELNTADYGDVVVTTGTAPFRTLRQTTFSASESQATDLANYLLGIYGDNGFGISEISCKSEAQNVWKLDMGYGWWDIIGYTTYVEFRGQSFRCVITGSSFSATPNESRFTYYLADIGLTPFLILDDAGAGLLDTNKLGW